MRTTISLDDHLLAEVKQIAFRTGRTMSAVIQDAIREAVIRRQPPPKKERIRLITFTGSGLQPGVNLDNGAELLDLMERPDADA